MKVQGNQILVGMVGGLMAGFAMNAFARAMDAVTDGQEAAGAARGRRRVGRGMQPPQASGAAEGDAAVRMGTAAYRVATGHMPARPNRLALGVATHYAFSMGTGAMYAVLSERWPVLRRGSGVLYGLLVWALADEGMVPALGLSRGPRQIPLGLHVYSIVGHSVYGATLEAIRRAGLGDWHRYI